MSWYFCAFFPSMWTIELVCQLLWRKLLWVLWLRMHCINRFILDKLVSLQYLAFPSRNTASVFQSFMSISQVLWFSLCRSCTKCLFVAIANGVPFSHYTDLIYIASENYWFVCVFLSSYLTELLLMTFAVISFSWLITLARTKTMQMNTGESIHVLVLFLSLMSMFLMLCHLIWWIHFICLKQFLSIPGLLRSVLLPADYTSFLSRGVNSFPYIFLENPEIVLTDWHLPALTSQLSQHGLEFRNVFSLLLLLTWDPGREGATFCWHFLHSPHSPRQEKIN